MARNNIHGVFICICLWCAPVGAQTFFSNTLQGKVLSDEKDVADVHVLNLTGNRATITDADGNFSISAKLLDTLLFSGLQFKRKTIVVTAGIMDSKQIVVYLEEFVNELDEVVVRPYDLSGDLDKDMDNMEIGTGVTAASLKLPGAYAKSWTQAERKLNEAITGGGIIPMNPVINAITGRTKYLKKLLKTERVYARTGRVRDFYADSLFTGRLQIPDKKINDFMYFCEVDDAFVSVVDTHDKLKIWEFLKKKSIVYRENNDLD